MAKEGKKNSRKGKRIIRRIICLLLVLLLGGAACFYVVRSTQLKNEVSYRSYTATVGSITNSLSFSGSLALVDSKAYTADKAADVKDVYVTPGMQVKAGDKLVRLSGGETVRADFAGTINTVSVEPGDTVAAGDSLCQLADFDHMTVSIRVDEYDINSVHVGDECRVTVVSSGKTFTSQIKTINYISSSTGNVAYYTATCDVHTDAGVYPGMQAAVTLPQESAENVVILKSDAISFDQTNQAYVWMNGSDGEMVQVPLEVGVSNGNYVEIKSGLRERDTVYAVQKNTADTSITGIFSSLFTMSNGNNGRSNRTNGMTMPGGTGSFGTGGMGNSGGSGRTFNGGTNGGGR